MAVAIRALIYYRYFSICTRTYVCTLHNTTCAVLLRPLLLTYKHNGETFGIFVWMMSYDQPFYLSLMYTPMLCTYIHTYVHEWKGLLCIRTYIAILQEFIVYLVDRGSHSNVTINKLNPTM